MTESSSRLTADGRQTTRNLAKRGVLCAIFLLLVPAMNAAAINSVTTNSAGALVFTNHFGDLNDDGQVDVRDVVLLTQHLNGIRLLPVPMLARADVNQDGKVEDTDRRILADMIARRNTGPNDDFDGDELGNAEEIRRGTNPFDPDTDHDGSLDGWEVAEDTDPLNPNSRIPTTIVARPPVLVIHPLIQDTDSSAPGPVVARPSVVVIHPLIQDMDTNAPGPVVARPPVTVINTNNPAK